MARSRPTMSPEDDASTEPLSDAEDESELELLVKLRLRTAGS